MADATATSAAAVAVSAPSKAAARATAQLAVRERIAAKLAAREAAHARARKQLRRVAPGAPAAYCPSATGGGSDGLDEQLYAQYDAAHPLGVPLLVNVLASVALAGHVIDAAPAFATCKAVWRRDAQLQWALARQERRKDKMTRLFFAIQRGYISRVVELLEWGSDVNARDVVRGLTPLHMAGACGKPEAARELLACGSKLEAKSKRGLTVLHVACIYGHAATVRFLLDAGANAEARDAQGSTPLLSAASRGHHGAMSELLARGADADVRCSDGSFLLIMAVKGNRAGLVLELIARGAALDVQDSHGDTALMCACKLGRIDIATALVQAGADLTLLNSDGRSALFSAETRVDTVSMASDERAAHLQLVALLLARGAP